MYRFRFLNYESMMKGVVGRTSMCSRVFCAQLYRFHFCKLLVCLPAVQ